MKRLSENEFEQLVNWAIELQQIPAPTFFESQRASYLAECFKTIGAKEVAIDRTGNVFCRIQGGKADPVLVAAHLDTVHPAGQSLPISRSPYSITGAGIGDNALGLAAMLSLADSILHSSETLEGDVCFAGTVGEEGLGNLKGIKAIVPLFSKTPHCAIILEGIGLGQIQQKALGVVRLRITVEAPGGHSWSDFGSPSAIHLLVNLAASINTIKLPTHPRTTLNIGMIQGGTAINTIAPCATMEIDLRSEDAETLITVTEYVKKKTEYIRQEGVKVTVEEIGSRPSGSIPLGDPFLAFASNVLIHLGVPPRTIISSTDASYLIQQHWPVISIGLTTGDHVHTPDETIDLLPLQIGMEQLHQIVANIWKINSPAIPVN